MSDHPISDELAKEMRAAWFRYLDTIESIRAELYRYCRRMSGNVWEAEDLVQETLLRGFATIGRGDLHGDVSRIANPRAYLFRTATNLWIDLVRHRRFESDEDVDVAQPDSVLADSIAAREAAARLIERATPQERAAVMLKDVFDLTLEEIAVILSTTVGAVKSALHRGRASLEEMTELKRSAQRGPSKELLDRFVAAFNARDVEGVTRLLLENTTLDVHGVGGERGKDMIWVRASMAARRLWPGATEAEALRAEPVMYRGEWIVVSWGGPRSAPILVTVERFEEEDGQIARIREYAYCPETLTEVAADLGVRAIPAAYHQPPETLRRMIAGSNLPWATKE